MKLFDSADKRQCQHTCSEATARLKGIKEKSECKKLQEYSYSYIKCAANKQSLNLPNLL